MKLSNNVSVASQNRAAAVASESSKAETDERAPVDVVERGRTPFRENAPRQGPGAHAPLQPRNVAPLGSTGQVAPTRWKVLRTGNYNLHYAEGQRADAQKVNAYLRTAYDRLSTEFGSHQPSTLLDGVRPDIYLHPTSNDAASDVHASMDSNMHPQRSGYRAQIHLLTPSAYPDRPGRSKSDVDDAVFRQVVHEATAVHVQRLSLDKPEGWQYGEAASWFLQGYDEYISGIHGPTDDKTLARYRADLQSDPDRVRFESDGTIHTQNPYSDGAVLVDFLHEKFGRDVVQSIWTSSEPTFNQALLKTLNTTAGDLQQQWQDWLARSSSE